MVTEAELQAGRNLNANLAAMGAAQPRLVAGLDYTRPACEWVFGRDGALTARLADGTWLAGCSVPRRAAEEMLKTLDARGGVVCFLAPTQTAQIEVALAKLRPEQAMLVVWPDAAGLPLALGCADLSWAIESGRLWWAVGPDWPAQIEHVLDERAGLPTPTSFIRLPLMSDADAKTLMEQAQGVFGRVNEQRTASIRQTHARWQSRAHPTGRFCVIAPSRFRLWEDDAQFLVDVLGPASVRIDPDDPRQASTLALARAAADCDAVVTANIARSDLSQVLHDEMPLITWVTGARMPAHTSAGPRDALLLADPRMHPAAMSAGWPPNRLAVAERLGWAYSCDPVAGVVDAGCGVGDPAHRALAIIADTTPVPALPEFEYSSHRLLWELIVSEMTRDPFLVGADVVAYLDSRMQRLQIAREGLDRRLFVDSLVLPAYQQGVAQAIAAAGLPLKLHGRRWSEMADLAPYAVGPLDSRQALREVVDSRQGGAGLVLIHVWPVPYAHPIEAMENPIIRAAGMDRAAFLALCQAALDGQTAVAQSQRHLLSDHAIKSFLVA